MSKTSPKTFVIIDGHAIIHRAYHALPPMNTKDGTIVNAVFGFTSMLLKVLSDIAPDYIAVSFDVEGGTFRDEVYEDYKATRQKADQDLYDQIPLVYQIVEAFNIPIYEKEGYEADDVIGSIAALVKKEKEKICTRIVTGDKDMLQLVEDGKTEVYLLKKGLSEFDLYNEAKVIERFSFGPEHITDLKALQGDSSDNIPGVAGIGVKTATALITQVGSLEDIYRDYQSEAFAQMFKPGVIKKLEAGKEDADMSKDLATIRTNVKGLGFKLKDAQAHEFDIETVKDLLKKFEFFSLLKRIPGAKTDGGQTEKKPKATGVKKVQTVDGGGLTDFLKQIKKEKEFSCKAILQGTDVLTHPLQGFVFGVFKTFYYIDVAGLTATQKKQVFAVFAEEKYTCVGHDLKQLVKILKMHDVQMQNTLFDIMVASYVINSSTRAHDLKSIVMRELGKEMTTSDDQGSLFGVDPRTAATELSYIQTIAMRFEKELEGMDDKGLFQKVEMALIPVLAQMELEGVAIDTKRLKELSVEFEGVVKKLVKNIHKEAGEEFNVASSVQLREVLYEKMELPTEGIKKGKTGYSTAASELEKLREHSAIIPMIEEFREVTKLQNTYVDVLPGLIHASTGRIHTSFNQTVAATGRLSSSDPNLQNIPIRTDLGKEIRNTFIAETGHVLLAADYSQIELRIVASLAKDQRLIEIFKNGEDVHTATAAAINDVPLEKVTKKMRSAAKGVNFGILYGMGAFGLSWRVGIPQWQAREFIEKYFEKFAGVKQYLDNTLKLTKKDGYVETLFGRRRYIPELSSDNYQIRSAGERMAINMPVQGTAADLMKLAMIDVQKKIAGNDDVRMTLQVHDELVFEVKKGAEKKIGDMVKEAMEGVATLRVPIEVHVGTGKRWGDLK